jgi:acetoin utilization deacetylase AcuC-like enzyme
MFMIAWHKSYPHPLPSGHRFPMEKYSLIPEQLIYEGIVHRESFFEPQLVRDEILALVHEKNYLHKLNTCSLSASEIRKTGFPLSPELIEREKRLTGGTVEAALFALEFGIAFNGAGGTHHAYADKGEGFCLLNDQAVAAAFLLDQKKVKRIAIIDLDVHQGNGTASIFQKEPRVFTFSMHGASNFPLHKETSDWDIPLPDDTSDEVYLSTLQTSLLHIIESFKPEFIFYQSGVDVLKQDKLGRLGLTEAGCKKRDQLVFKATHTNHIPVCVSLGGGYSERISDIVNAHVNTFRCAHEIWF